jgi:hexulose-6-phosphate isomerase
MNYYHERSNFENLPIGIYEKAFPEQMSLQLKIERAKSIGYDFFELSIDESDDKISRLLWNSSERLVLKRWINDTGLNILTMCLSAHRRYPMGSHDPKIREQSLQLLDRAIDLSLDLGIRTIQLAGYDVYYENSDSSTIAWFFDGMNKAVEMAARNQVMLGIETMDTCFINSIPKALWVLKHINSPWLSIYPDLGNLHAWHGVCWQDIELGSDYIVAVHIKETRRQNQSQTGVFRNLLYTEGDVDHSAMLTVLKNISYSGLVVLEFWNTSSITDTNYIASALHWIKNEMRNI